MDVRHVVPERGRALWDTGVRQGRSFGRHAGVRVRSSVRSRVTDRDYVPGLLSLIVPVYDVEEYLDECLNSLRGQDYPHVEIIVVDDGTPDRSVRLARRQRLRDPRIRIVHRPNGGLSAARNTGVDAARGEFIAFADSDDTVPAHGYRAAVESLLASGSDFAVLPYQRLRGELITAATKWIRDAHREDRIAITVEDYPFVMVNAIMCSKVWRRDFWTGAGLRFVEGIIYEDQQVSAEAYTRARCFDVLTVPVYNWRSRDDRTSISQNKTKVANLRAQFLAANESIKVLRTYGSERIVTERLTQLLCNDMPQFTSRIPGSEDGFWQLLGEELPELIDQLDPEEYLARVNAQQKVLNHLIVHDQREEAERFLRDGGISLRTVRVGEEAVGKVAYLPLWRDEPARVPDECFRLSDRQTWPRTSIRAVRATSPTTFEVDAWAFLDNVDISRSEQQVTARAFCPGEPDVELPVRQGRDEAIDEFFAAGSGHCDYRNGAVTVQVDVTALPPGRWRIRLDITVGAATRTVTLARPWACGSAALRHAFAAGEQRAAMVSAAKESPLLIRVYDDGVVADTVRLEGDRLHLHGPGPAPAEIRVSSRAGSAGTAGRIQADPADPERGWQAEFPLDRSQVSHEHVDTATMWLFSARTAGGAQAPVRFAPAALDGVQDDALRWRASADRTGELMVRTRTAAVQVTDASVDETGVTVALRALGLDLHDWQALFESRPASTPATMTVKKGQGEAGDAAAGGVGGGGIAHLAQTESRWGWDDQVLVSAAYTLLLEHRRTGERLLPLATPELIDALPLDVVAGRVRAKVQLHAVEPRALSVVVAPPLAPDERGVRNQLRLQELANAGAADEHAVFFRSLYGEVANDNALAVHQELVARGSDLTLYWGVTDHSVRVPEGAVPVLEESREWHERLGGARYVMLNVHQPMWYVKPERQVMVETFHGYPYKGMGQSWWGRSGLALSRVASFLERAADWDYLVSPAGYATPALLREFFGAEAAKTVTVLETGYPRNDVLLSPAGDKVRERVRSALGIAPDQTAVLYAPTFRDYLSNDGMTAAATDFFDPVQAATALGPSYVVMMRGHAFNARANALRAAGANVVDVTYYPDVADLILASDAAVLDYSSLRFDYALTRKPMVFLVPDNDVYHTLRPAIMPFGPTAPGPHVSTTAEAVQALRRPEATRRRHGAALERFVADYLELEDGHAAARVVDAVFGAGSRSELASPADARREKRLGANGGTPT